MHSFPKESHMPCIRVSLSCRQAQAGGGYGKSMVHQPLALAAEGYIAG